MTKPNIQLQKCYLDFVKIVHNHEIKSDLILTYGAFLKQLSQNLGGNVKSHSVPDSAPPEVPRVSVLAKETAVHFCLNRVEVELKGTRKHLYIEKLSDAYDEKLERAISLVQSYLNRDSFIEGFTGVIAPVRFPQPLEVSKTDILENLYERIRGKSESEIATFNVKIGKKTLNRKGFVNYEISDYEVKNINVKPTTGVKHIQVNLDEFPTVERGVLVVVDVNNRPADKFEFAKDQEVILEEFFNSIKSIEKTL